MKYVARKLASAMVFVALCAMIASGQVTNSGSISGTVTDSTGAVVPNASVTAKNNGTGIESTATSSDNGTFTIPLLPTGVYTVTVQATSGFKRSEVTNVKVDVGTPATVNVLLEVGTPQETVTITGGGEVLQTQTATVGTTITGRQITDLPFTSRDSLDLVLMLPGTATPARPRSSSINGLPKGTLNITLDGVPDQAEDAKSSDGFFTFVRPRIDAIEEVSLSSAVPGAESSGDGAVQLRFSTRSGTNEFHGSAYWYHRNTWLNANYYFNNLAGQPRQLMILNQPGVRVGGPILIPHLIKSRNRANFFVNYEEFRLPASTSRQRNILSPDAATGIFKYGTATPVNLLALAANTDCDKNTLGIQPCTSTIDPAVAAALTAIRTSTAQGAVAALGLNQQLFSYNAPSSSVRKFTTVRFDYNITKKHHLDEVWNYNIFRGAPDTLNGRDPAFPGLGAGVGGQFSNRFSNSIGLRSTLKSNLINEARFGIGDGGTVLFFPETSPSAFSIFGGVAPSFTVFAPGGNSTSSPFAGTSSSRNGTPVKVLLDNLSYVKGNHTLNFGSTFTQINTYAFSINEVVPTVTFGLNTNDPAAAIFTAANFPNSNATDITNAQNLYALLTGRVTAVSGNAYLGETTGKYTYLGDYTERMRQRVMGTYVQDAWRFHPNLTINAGLRWDIQFPFIAQNNNYAQTTVAGLYGVSGAGNLFKPGTLAGTATQFNQLPPNQHVYNTDWNNFAPSIGAAWSPNTKDSWMRHLMGQSGQTVLRGGYSLAFVREGSNVALNVFDTNPGGFVNANRSIAIGNLPAGTLLRNLASVPLATIPASPAYPITGLSTDAAIAFNPNIKVGYVHSWTAGIQRELTKNTVFEARYVGNRGRKLWRTYNLNEVNTVENGFINEFKLAQANLFANIAAGKGNTFAYTGAPGTSPLPIMLAFFGGNKIPTDIASYTATQFSSATFYNQLLPQNANPIGFACCSSSASLFGSSTFRNNAAAAFAGGRTAAPSNIFLVNPDKIGGASLVDNTGNSWYDSLQLELRRRMSRGLLMQANYTFSKALSDAYGGASSSVVRNNFSSLRFPNLNKTPSSYDLRHSFKTSWIWELPAGRGQWLLKDANGLVDRLAGGWAIHGQARIQSGSTFSFGNVQLIGMTKNELQKSIKIRQDPKGAVFYLPDDIIQNTIKAFNAGVSGYTLGTPSGRFIAPASSNGCLQSYVGQCGFSNLILYGPHLTRFDISLVKKTKITERMNIEMRGEFLNAFNNINFKVGSQSSEVSNVAGFSGSTFGQTFNAYQDLSTTNDPGGRMVQLVLRINF